MKYLHTFDEEQEFLDEYYSQNYGEPWVSYVRGTEKVDYNKEPTPVPEYVDLGLPSGKLWAKTNIGASSPEEAGYYFAWGETYSKPVYDQDTYKFGNEVYTKYNSTDEKTELDEVDDAANQLLGGYWHVPTAEDFAELVNSQNTTEGYATINGVWCKTYTSKTNPNNYVAFAKNGDKWYDEEEYVGTYGRFWTADLQDENYDNPLMFGFCEGGADVTVFDTDCIRAMGCPIRAIYIPPLEVE